ncbi:pyridoxine 5'-phosphate synthase [Ruegeria meonggei]|uniref:pyridoxine 5'-phosphate synthase n=1 Tax=Ruegeria meonggei TaxID=1446476 RepID=UPI00366CC81F
MTMLSVNMNVAALLRNRRDHAWPDVVKLGRIALEAGAGGLTVYVELMCSHRPQADI